MTLKSVTGALLLLALLAQSSAFETTSDTSRPTPVLRDASLPLLPGFYFYRNLFGVARISANAGNLYGYDAILNTTKWTPIIGTNSKTASITQNITFPALSVAYYNTSAKFGLLKSSGELVADLGSNTFNLTLNATAYMNECRLQVKLQLASDLRLVLNLDDLGSPGVLITRVRPILEGVVNSVADSMREVLANHLSWLVKDVLVDKFDMDELCKNVLASSETYFPEPLFH